MAARARDLRDSGAEQEAIRVLDGLSAAAEATPLGRPEMSPDEDPLWSAYRALVIAETCRCRGSARQSEAWDRVATRHRAIGFRWFERPAALATLTSREREVLSHLVAGQTNAEIARDLFISDKTVSVHVTNLLRKTGTTNRIEAAALARRLGVHSR